MTDDNGHQPITIGHQRDSGDLKIRAEGQIPLSMLCNSLRHSNTHGIWGSYLCQDWTVAWDECT